MSIPSYQPPLPHYYGDITRIIFIVIGVIMLLGLPSMTQVLNLSAAYPIVAIIILGVAAGYTNPKKRGSLLLNIWVSVIGLAAFIYISLFLRSHFFTGGWLFLNQIIAILFLVSLYFSIKSLRGYSKS
jgi:hypothetical protein